MSEWQKIETAPKDTWILGWAPGWIVVSMCWEDTRAIGGRCGWYVEFDGERRKFIDATHWQPLPAPPSPANETDDR